MYIKNYWFKSLSVCFALATVLLFERAIVAGEQEQNVYLDPEKKYELILPPNWRAVNYQDGAGNSRVDIVYRDRTYGLLKISQENSSEPEMDNLIRDEIDQNLRFRPGYVFSGIERFVGEHARGKLLEFSFSHAGQPKKGRNYYLKTGGTTVWVLRFAGNRESLGPLRHETDLIARSFKPL
jgi:hypothetical protein